MRTNDGNSRRRRAPVDADRAARQDGAAPSGSLRHDSFDPSAYGRQSASSYSRYSRDAYGRGSHAGDGLDEAGSPSRGAAGYGRDAAASRYGRSAAREGYAREHKKRSRRRKIVIGILVGVLAVALVAVATVLLFYRGVAENLKEGLDPALDNVLVETDLANEPFYMLLLGTDGSAEREASADFAGDPTRTDTIILLRVDAPAKTATLVSLPRDTMIELEGYGTNKLNAAYAYGGASLAVETVSQLAGVPISHYAQINFDGFRDIVNALGGIEVDVPMTIDDADAGGHLDAGLQTLNGDQALILCRARHAYDEVGPGDLYRAANQRLVLTAIAKKILSSDLVTIASSVNAISQYVTTDLDPLDIVGLAQALQGMDTSTSIFSATLPTTSEYINDLWYEVVDEDAWDEMMARVEEGLAPTEESLIDENTGTVLAAAGDGAAGGAGAVVGGDVVVRNGNGVAGAAAEAEDLAEDAGYTVVDTGNAESFDYEQTLVIYDDAAAAARAQTLADALGVGVVQQNDGSYLFEGDFLVVLGADWEERATS